MAHYYFIFKTDNLTGKTTNICGGSHETIEECHTHFRAYSYGFMDGAVELLGHYRNFQMMDGCHGHYSFQFSCDILTRKMNVEYFMLLDEDGDKLIAEISK